MATGRPSRRTVRYTAPKPPRPSSQSLFSNACVLVLKSGFPENMTSLPELASVAGEWLYSSSPLDRARAAAEGEVEERTRRFRTVTVITPRAMKAAAPIAISAEMLRMIFL